MHELGMGAGQRPAEIVVGVGEAEDYGSKEEEIEGGGGVRLQNGVGWGGGG